MTNEYIYIIMKKGILMREAYKSPVDAFVFMVERYLEDTHVPDDRRHLLEELNDAWQSDDDYICLGDVELHKISLV